VTVEKTQEYILRSKRLVYRMVRTYTHITVLRDIRYIRIWLDQVSGAGYCSKVAGLS
jgi:hypothetical protein